MRFRVRHLARYRYDAPVGLGPHVLRLTPRGARGMAHGIRVTPEPAVRYDATDAHGNLVTSVGFTGKATELVVEARFELETRRTEPPGPGAPPVHYLMRGEADAGVSATARRLHALAGPDPAAFADSLISTLHGAITIDPTDAAPTRMPGDVLARGRGSTRDVLALFIELARRADLPARFVSGYWAESRDPASRRAHHNWAEVLLPDVGWRGYDPSLGTRTGEGHVAMAAAPNLSGTLPVWGATFSGAFGMGIRMRTGFELSVLTP